MANLPSMGDREVLNSLRAQERLLENIANAITKRDSTLSRKEVKGDKRVVDEQQEQSMIKKLLSAFSGFGKTRLSAQELQLKTLEETKVTKSIVQRTGLDIEFIRKSFEEGQKKKDRELLAEAIKSSIGDGSGGRGTLASIFAGIGSSIITGLKLVTGIIGAAFRSILGVFSIAGLTSIFKGALKLSGLAALFKSSDTASDDYKNTETYRNLKNAGPGSDIFENNVQEMARNEHFSQYLSKNPLQKEEYDKKSFDEQNEMKNKYFDELFDLASYSQELGEELTDYYNAFDRANIQELAAYNKQMAKLKESLEQTTEEIQDVDTSSFDTILKEGEEVLDKATESIKSLAGIISESDIFGTLKEGISNLGTLKFADGEVNLFEGVGDAMAGLLNSARGAYQDEAQQIMSERGNMSTQVNNTNVIGGSSGSSPVYFPNATAIDGHSSLSRFLQSSGAIR